MCNGRIDIRKMDVDNERLQNCISCDEVSSSLQVESMYEIILFYPSKKIYLCNHCIDRFKRALKNIE